MSNEDLIVRTEKLCRSFGEVEALRDLSLEVRRGEVFGLVGPDGAGKTTIMRILAGVLPPSSGDAWIDGISVARDPEAVKEHLAYMPQRFGLYEDLSVMENLVFYADLFQVPQKSRPQRIETLFNFSRLKPFQDRPAGALSGGMKQKLGLACALIHSPRLLLLDEPTNGVDPVSRRDFWKILYDLLQEGISILVSTAYIDEADRTHRVGLVNEGRIIHCGEPAEIKKLMKGVFFELATSDMMETKRLLENAPGLLDANLFGEGLHVRVEKKEDINRIRRIVQDSGIEIYAERQIPPAMEDAFLALLRERREQEAQGQAGAS